MLLLDFDGTLANTAPGIIRTMRATFDAHTLAQPTNEAICATIGLPLIDSIERLAGITRQQATEASTTYHRLFDEVGVKGITLFPGVKETLHGLHSSGIRTAIVTSRGHKSTASLCKSLGIHDAIDAIAAVEDVGHAKPHPEGVLKMLTLFSAAAEESLVVGDTTFDIGMGKNAGCRTCGVSYGNHTTGQLREAGADFIVESFNCISNIICNL